MNMPDASQNLLSKCSRSLNVSRSLLASLLEQCLWHLHINWVGNVADDPTFSPDPGLFRILTCFGILADDTHFWFCIPATRLVALWSVTPNSQVAFLSPERAP